MAFFKEGFSKLMGAVRQDAAPAPPALPPYHGRLSPDQLRLSDGILLGPGAVVPQTLACCPKVGLVAFCTTAGHVRVVRQEIEVTLNNPMAPMHPEFLLLPRPGLILVIGIATGRASAGNSSASSGSPSASSSSWVAHWWELKQVEAECGSRVPQPEPQTAFLRYGVSCVAASSTEASLVFLGTDEGDVRVFDAGEVPGVGSYCVPWTSLQADKRSDSSRPCPITALASAPQAQPDLLVGTAEGRIVLWSFQKHQALRSFDSAAAVTSIIWHPSGSQFLVASRNDISIFSRASSSSTARVVLPGGASSHVTLLSWVEDPASPDQDAGSPNKSSSPVHGQVVLRRGTPNPTVLVLSGSNWAKVERMFADAPDNVASAVLCARDCDSLGAGSRFGCPACPFAASFADDLNSSGSDMSAATAAQTTVVAVLGGQLSGSSARLAVAQSGHRSLSWPVSWGSLPLAGASTLHLVSKELLATASQSNVECAAAAVKAVEKTQSPCEAHTASSPSSEFQVGMKDGELLNGAVPLPEGKADLEPDGGWFVCLGPLDPEDDQDEGEGMRWPLANEVGEVHCELSLGLDAKAGITLCYEEGRADEVFQFDGADQKASLLIQPETEIHCGADISPGVTHKLELLFRRDEAGRAHCEVLWDGQHLALSPPPADTPERGKPKFVLWRCLEGELRLCSLYSKRPSPVASTPTAPEPEAEEAASEVAERSPLSESLSPVELLEAMHAAHVANFSSFVEDSEIEPAPQRFLGTWEILKGGFQGLLCSGHLDGSVRIWLRSHSALLLVHVLRVRPPAQGMDDSQVECANPTSRKSRQGWYDGIDAYSVASTSDGEDLCSHSPEVTAVVFEPTTGSLAVGCKSGEIVFFQWLPTKGFTCTLHMRQHDAPVAALRLVEPHCRMRIVWTDVQSRLGIVDGSNGDTLFVQRLGTPASKPNTGAAPQPPAETLEALVPAEGTLHVHSTDAPAAGSFRPEPRLGSDSQTVHSDASGPSKTDAIIFILSSGELRQLSTPDMTILDTRIRETRLPKLSGGAVLLLDLRTSFLLVVQPSTTTVFMREDGYLRPTGHSTSFVKQAVAARAATVAGEQCLLVLLGNGMLEVLVLPSLRTVASLPAGGPAGQALMGPSTDSASSFGPAAGGCICSDGYFVLRGEGGGFWLAAALEAGSGKSLEATVQATSFAELAQALLSSSPLTPSVRTAPETGSGGTGLLSSIFGRGAASKTLRECAAPSNSQALPASVSAEQVDRARGLGQAWRDPRASRPPPPPPPPEQRAKQAVRAPGLQDALAGAGRAAAERGETMGELANKSKKLADDSAQFLDLAKQLNKQQNKWF